MWPYECKSWRLYVLHRGDDFFFLLEVRLHVSVWPSVCTDHRQTCTKDDLTTQDYLTTGLNIWIVMQIKVNTFIIFYVTTYNIILSKSVDWNQVGLALLALWHPLLILYCVMCIITPMLFIFMCVFKKSHTQRRLLGTHAKTHCCLFFFPLQQQCM